MSVKTTWVGGGQFGTKLERSIFLTFPPPTALNPDALPLDTYDTKMAASNGKSLYPALWATYIVLANCPIS